MQAETIETKRLFLRGFQKEDAVFAISIWNDSEMGEYLPDEAMDRIDAAYLEEIEKLPEDAVCCYMTAECKDTREMIGTCSFMPSKDGRVYDIAYCVHKKYWRNGYATEMAGGMVDYAKKHGAVKVTARVNKKNAASNAVVKKLGFVPTGEKCYKKRGTELQFCDYLYEYRITDNERSFINSDDWKIIWKQEEKAAHIHGWDFSHIHGRYEAETDLPWDYETLVRSYLKSSLDILDYDTGGGEFLLSLNHPYDKTSATEGYPPNATLCAEKLLPLGINFKACGNPSEIPFENASFDLILNRHGAFDAAEVFRLLRRGGIFITEQVGEDNDRDLVELVLPGTEKPFPHLNLTKQRRNFENAGFQIIQAKEAYRPIKFYDIGAFVWFAHIIEWEFPGFSVDSCFERLLNMQKMIDKEGKIEGTIHRYLIVAKK